MEPIVGLPPKKKISFKDCYRADNWNTAGKASLYARRTNTDSHGESMRAQPAQCLPTQLSLTSAYAKSGRYK